MPEPVEERSFKCIMLDEIDRIAGAIGNGRVGRNDERLGPDIAAAAYRLGRLRAALSRAEITPWPDHRPPASDEPRPPYRSML